MATLEEMAQSGEIPSDPSVLQAVKDGSLSLDQVKSYHQKSKQTVTPAPAESAPQEPSKPLNAFQRGASLKGGTNDVLESMAAQDQLPSDPAVLQAIKDGSITLDQATSYYAKQKQNIITSNAKGQINRPDNLQSVASKDTASVGKVAQEGADQQSFWDKAYEATKGFVNTAVKGGAQIGQAFQQFNQDLLTSPVQTTKSFTKELLTLSRNEKNMIKKAMSVGSMGLTEKVPRMIMSPIATLANPSKALEPLVPGEMTGGPGYEVAGAMMDMSALAGSSILYEGLGAGKALGWIGNKLGIGGKISALAEEIPFLKNIKTVAQASGDVGASKGLGRTILRKQITKTALSTAQSTVEGAQIGLATGATKGAFGYVKDLAQGNPEADPTDIVSNALSDAVAFGVGGAALTPLLEVAGSVMGLKWKPLTAAKDQERKTIGPFLGNPQEARAQQSLASLAKNDLAQRIATKEASSDEVFTLLQTQAKDGTITPQGQKALNAKYRIDALAPEVAPEIRLISNPEFMKEVSANEIAKVSNSIFSDPKFKSVADNNPALGELVRTGQHEKALISLRDSMTKEVVANGTLMDHVKNDYLKDAGDLNQVIANRVLERTEGKYPALNEGMIKDYLDNPTDASAQQSLKEASNGNIFRTIRSKAVMDTRLNPVEANVVVDNLLSSKIKAVQGEIKFDDLTKVIDLNNITKTAMTFNKGLFSSLMDVYKRDLEPAFVTLPNKDLIPAAQTKIKLSNVQDELLLISNDKAQLNQKIGDIQRQISSKAITEEEGLKTIETLKTTLVEKSKQASQKMATMRGYQNVLQGLTPDQNTALDQFMDQVYRPSGSSVATGVARKDVQNVFGADNNPYFLRKDSGLADTMDAFLVSGLDTKISPAAFSVKTLLNTKTVWGKLADEFGPAGEVFRQFGDVTKSRFVDIEKDRAMYLDKLKATDIKIGSKESAALQQYIENPSYKISNEWLSLPDKARQKIEDAAPVLKGLYSEMLGRINGTMERLNLPQIQARADYVTHFQESQSIWSELIDHFMKGKTEMKDLADKIPGQLDVNGSKFIRKDNKTFFAYGMKRSGAEFTSDAIQAFTRYMDPALKRIHLSDLVREVDVASKFAPQNLSDFLQGFKDRYLLDKQEVIDQLSEKGLTKASRFVRDRMARGAILYNINTLVNQVTSAPLSLGISGPESFHAARYRFTNEGQAAIGLSKNLALRDIAGITDVDGRLVKSTIDKIIPSWAKDPARAVRDFTYKIGSHAVEIFDREAATHAYLTSYLKAKKQGLNPQQASLFADKMVDFIHADVSKMGRPDNAFFQSSLGKAFAQFQSFTLNLASTIATELPRMAKTEGASAAVASLLRAGAAIELVNSGAESIGVPQPFGLDAVLPFGNLYKMGAPGFFGITQKVYQNLADEKWRDKLTSGDFGQMTDAMLQSVPKRSLAALAVVGGGQMAKSGPALEKLANGEYDSMADFVKEFVYGERSIAYAEGQARSPKGFAGRQRFKLQDKIRGKLGQRPIHADEYD